MVHPMEFRVFSIAIAALMLSACAEPEALCSEDGHEVCGAWCVNTRTNASHCGGCDMRCADGALCSMGLCVGGETCDAADQERCGAECVNIWTSGIHCGGCNNTCGLGASCVGGVCSCVDGLTYCGEACVNTASDPAHCGGCRSPCGADQGCYLGGCATPHPESCDRQDNDLDGETDEDEYGMPLMRPCDNLCGPGYETCSGGVYIGCTAPIPGSEVCNDQDDDCDGLVDEGVTDIYYEDLDLDGFGDPDPASAIEACAMPYWRSPGGGVYVSDSSDCDDGDAQVYPGAAEACDGVDNNCDGDPDENCACAPVGATRACGSDEGICAPGVQTCSASGWGECTGASHVAPLPAELCNGFDDDCDGEVDEGMGGDRYEGNDSCELARALPDVVEGEAPILLEGLSLYHGSSETSDSDWYAVRVRETAHTVECALAGWPPLQTQCDFLFLATLTVPSDTVHQDYQLCINSGLCGEFEYSFCTDASDYKNADHTYNMVLAWDGSCGIDDSWDFYLEIKSTRPGINYCESYSLELGMGWTGDIGEACSS